MEPEVIKQKDVFTFKKKKKRKLTNKVRQCQADKEIALE
jgi:hypothetical protein